MQRTAGKLTKDEFDRVNRKADTILHAKWGGEPPTPPS